MSLNRRPGALAGKLAAGVITLSNAVPNAPAVLKALIEK